MKFDPANLGIREAHYLLTSCVVPRPIAFVSTVGPKDDKPNVAAFSCFASLSIKPMLVGIGVNGRRDGRKKDTLVNIELHNDFVINVVTEALAEAMNKASSDYPSDVSEFQEVGLTPIKADLVKAPMVAESPINMECVMRQILQLAGEPRPFHFIIGEVVRVHVKDELYANGQIDQRKLEAVGRMGGGLDLYCRTLDTFELKRAETNL